MRKALTLHSPRKSTQILTYRIARWQAVGISIRGIAT
jgi:hypothetical protein